MVVNRQLGIYIFLSSIMSYLIGTRYSFIGSDTVRYINHFYNNAKGVDFLNRYEIGFSSLMFFISNYINRVEVFFFVIAFIITFYYLIFFKNIFSKTFSNENISLGKIFIFCSLLIISSWYMTLSTNGLRQGVSLIFLYLSLYQFFYKKFNLSFIILYLISVSFHYSSLLVLPFLLLNNLKCKLLYIIWILLAIGYLLRLKELIVE